jgi:hypothetical protein
VVTAPHVELALAHARLLAGAAGAVLVTGSITLVAQVRDVLGLARFTGAETAGESAAVGV